jgi:hypothetical protein
MKFGKIFNLTQNKRTNQISFNVRAREIKKIGINPIQVLEMTIPASEIKFFKKQNKKNKKK